MLKQNTDPELYTYIVFIIATLLTLYTFWRAANRSRAVLVISLAWLFVQGMVAATGFYTDTLSMPPRFALLPLPPFFLILMLFLLPRGRSFINGLSLHWLTMLHIVRVPVEIVLFWLFSAGMVPQLMIFEGRNFDIISGLSAPLVYYAVFVKRWAGTSFLVAWNVICLGLLINIVVNAILSAPTPFQQFGFEQPNTGVLFFPFVWLPAFIVPVVLLSHLAVFRQVYAGVRLTSPKEGV